METIINQEEAQAKYAKLKPSERKLIEQFLKKEELIIPESTIVTWEQVAKLKKMHPVNSLPFPKPKNDREKRMNVQWMMDVMVEYFNTDPESGKVWEPKSGDLGYRVWYYDHGPGVGFRFGDSYYDFDLATLGSRLHFKTSKIADDAGKALEKLQNDLFKTSNNKSK